MTVTAIIPARYGSTRFPGKPLARQTGKYLIQHVYERVAAAREIDECLIATDDERIARAAGEFGATAVMTRPDHASGTERIAEVVAGRAGADDDLIVNVQGDEPEIKPESLDRLIARMRSDARCECGTLACPFPADADPQDPNRVKVVCDERGEALYFSRARIPHPRDADADAAWLLHVGVYAYRRAFLLEYAAWPATPLERIEKLEQLRVLEHGRRMAVVVVSQAPAGVDTPEDYAAFVARQAALRP